MRRTLLVLLAILVLGTAGVVGFLATWDIPAPSARVEKVIPNDRLPR
ncbi:MAG: hypothetical protein J0H39_14115 [Alphaproteobacteria bacterium]|nr:hypothetical protein [Alphaproteobacteria bacterium]MBN9497887.1 hypothetical protein [Alphaproteobacteria bacterium]